MNAQTIGQTCPICHEDDAIGVRVNANLEASIEERRCTCFLTDEQVERLLQKSKDEVADADHAWANRNGFTSGAGYE